MRWITIIVSLLVMASLSVSVASAAPTNAPSANTPTLTCDNGETYTIVTNGNGFVTPGHIIGGDGQVLIADSFVLEIFDANGELVFRDEISHNGKRKGLSDDLIVCNTPGGTFEFEGETFTFVQTVTVFVTPRG